MASNRLQQLDSLRGIAVLLVVLHHWTGWAPNLGLGNIGVQLFFVLSGFLITRILLGFKDRRAVGKQGMYQVLLSFHASRAARIWPVFFLTIALVYAAGDRFENHKDIAWHALLASNFLFFERGEFGSSLAHFWSLAVEQQFYLFWPLLVLLVPERRFELVVISLVLAAPIARLTLFATGYADFAEYNVLPIANLDSLGLGALAAVWSPRLGGIDRMRERALAMLAGACAAVLFVLRLQEPLPANLEQSLYSIVFAWLVLRAKSGFCGPMGHILEWRPLVSLGLISYGVYVYHMFAPRIAGAIMRALETPAELQSGVPLFVLSALLTLAAANLSWFLMERPILDWRRSLQINTTKIQYNT